MKKVAALSITAMALAFGTPDLASAGDAAAGKTKYDQMCVACHGADGNKTMAPNYPKLAGQNAAYTVQQLKDFKSGARSNGQAAMMKGLVAALSDTDIDNVAAYIASLK